MVWARYLGWDGSGGSEGSCFFRIVWICWIQELSNIARKEQAYYCRCRVRQAGNLFLGRLQQFVRGVPSCCDIKCFLMQSRRSECPFKLRLCAFNCLKISIGLPFRSPNCLRQKLTLLWLSGLHAMVMKQANSRGLTAQPVSRAGKG